MSTTDEIMLKHGRAHEHLERLSKECNEFLRSEPFTIEVVGDDTGRHYEFVVRNLRPVPPHVALTIGDVLHNARCVLDHLAWRLATDADRHTSFPILKARPNQPLAISGVTDQRVIDLVERIQPYNQENPNEDLLLILNRLDNFDKHRLLVTTVAASEGARHGIEETSTGQAILSYQWGELEQDQPFATIEFPEPNPTFIPQFQVTPYVGIKAIDSFEGTAPAINILWRILQRVATTVNEFRTFL